MPITCICPKCRQTLSIADQYAGQPMRCPFCSSMFQSPSLASTPMPAAIQQTAPPRANPFSDGAAAGYDGPAPPWQQKPKDPHAPEWPWLIGKRPAQDAAYDWRTVPGSATLRLAPGWHMVLRGMSLLPGSLLAVFTTMALTILFVQLTTPEPETRKILLLIVIPIIILGSLVALIGLGLCCLVPLESRLRSLAVISAGGAFMGLLAALLAAFLWFVRAQPGWIDNNPGLAGVAKFVMLLAFIVGLILLVGGGALYLWFLRGIAHVFDSRRLERHLLWYLLFFALTPAFALFLLALFKGTAAVLGMHDPETGGAINVIYVVAEFILGAIVLAGFLTMLREVRLTIERAILPAKA